MKIVFADTCYWIALAAPRDHLHDAAKSARKAVGHCTLLTNDEVLTEFLNALSGWGPKFRLKAVQTVRALAANPNVRILPQTRESFMRALARYEQRDDKGYSLVDCACMNAMDQEGIREVLTHDHHFEQEGYTTLIKGNGSA